MDTFVPVAGSCKGPHRSLSSSIKARRAGEPDGQSEPPSNQWGSLCAFTPWSWKSVSAGSFDHLSRAFAWAAPKSVDVSATTTEPCSRLPMTVMAGYADTWASNASTSCIVQTCCTAYLLDTSSRSAAPYWLRIHRSAQMKPT